MNEGGAADEQEELDGPEDEQSEEGEEERPRIAATPQRRRVRVRNIPFTVENPCSMLHNK